MICMQLFQHIASPEHRLAMLAEFHRVSRDTVIVAVRLQNPFGRRSSPIKRLSPEPLANRALVEAEFKLAGFSLLSHQDFFPGCARMRVYVLRKTN
jgi:hypothetical protein